ncbi:hypothetical protein LCGC14_2563960, partial [marine sediment metagenome]
PISAKKNKVKENSNTKVSKLKIDKKEKDNEFTTRGFIATTHIDDADDTIFEVLIAHTTPSTGTFAASRTAIPANWAGITVDATFRGNWAAGTQYAINEFVTDAGRYGIVKALHTSVTSYNQGVTDGNIETLIDANTIISSNPTAAGLAEGASPTVTYDVATGVFAFGIPVGATGATGSPSSDAELVALAGLVSAADQLPFFTGSGTAALTTLTAAARTVLDDASVDDMLATLGGIGAATSDTLTNKTFDANGTGNSLSNVDIADLANGTDGELITWDATAVPATVPVGASGEILTSNGVGAGTSMLFQQTAAPVGWTKQTTHNNKSIRLQTGTVTTGGANNFTTVFGTGKTTASFTITTTQSAAHTHTVSMDNATGANVKVARGGTTEDATHATSSSGGGSGHSHNLTNLDLQFVDFIIADKD